MIKRGKFITFESGEGGGKTSVINNLKKILSPNKFVFVNDPSSFTKELSAIRKVLLSSTYNYSDDAELLLYAAARAELVSKIIKPALESGKHVISDRFYDSTKVYQGHIRGHSQDKLHVLNTEFAGDLEPDMTILFDVDPKTGLSRSISRLDNGAIDESRWESLGLEVHTKINAFYKHLAKKYNRFCVIDSNKNDIKQMTYLASIYINALIERG